jgi:NADPH:quinone reductase-like Zn-dependent oxidoreductase
MHTAVGLSMRELSRLRPELIEGYRKELWTLLAAGALRPVSVSFPLERAAEAAGALADRANLGKVLLDLS